MTNTYKMWHIHSKIEKLYKRIDELHEGLESCTDPILYGNLLGSISILVEEQSILAKQLNELKQDAIKSDLEYQNYHKQN